MLLPSCVMALLLGETIYRQMDKHTLEFAVS